MGWTTADIPDLTGRCAIVTGGNGGLGLSISRALAAHGAQLVIAARNADKAKAAAERITAETPAAQVEFASLDLSDLDSVRGFAAGWTDRPLHLLVNNAGVMAIPLARTKAGFEMQFGTNHLGHFALTGLLLPALIRSGAGRVVTMSSTAHKTGKMRFDDLQSEQRYGKFSAYGQSKLANLLFMRELDRRLTAAGAPVISVAAHPGYAATELQTLGPRVGRQQADGADRERRQPRLRAECGRGRAAGAVCGDDAGRASVASTSVPVASSRCGAPRSASA